MSMSGSSQQRTPRPSTTRNVRFQTPPTNGTAPNAFFLDANTKLIQVKAAGALRKLDTAVGSERFQTNIDLILQATKSSPLGTRNINTPSRSPFRKRRRDPDVVPIPNDVEIAANQRPLKRLKMSNNITVQPELDIFQLNPNPLRISYKPHPSTDRGDEFYTEAFRRLFRQLERFVFTYYCLHDLDQGEFFEPWADIDFGPEFMSWAGQVAEPDPNNEGWDQLLRNTTQRKWFIMGIIIRVLKIKVFDEDFFGANRQQKELLFGIERAFLTREGYARTALRAETCRTIIAGNAVTEYFYPQVAELTAQIAFLLQPLTKYLYALTPPENKVLPKLQDLYQSLHNIVSTSAYLSLGIRLSPTIFYFMPIDPRTVYSSEHHHSLEQQIYLDSKQKVLDNFAHLYTERNSPLRVQERALIQKLACTPNQNSRAWRKANTALIKLRTATPPLPGYSHCAMAKIVAWPAITRYKPGAAGEETKALKDMDGQRTYPICKGAVVCYFGETEATKNTLRRFVRAKKEENARVRGVEGGGFGQRASVVAAVAAVAAAGAALVVYGGVGVDVTAQANEVVGILGVLVDYTREYGREIAGEIAGEVVDKFEVVRAALGG